MAVAAIKGERTLIELAQDFDGRDLSGSRFDEGEEHDLTDGLDLEFDRAEDIPCSWRKGIRPDPDLTVSEWADQHRWLSSRGAAEPGR